MSVATIVDDTTTEKVFIRYAEWDGSKGVGDWDMKFKTRSLDYVGSDAVFPVVDTALQLKQ